MILCYSSPVQAFPIPPRRVVSVRWSGKESVWRCAEAAVGCGGGQRGERSHARPVAGRAVREKSECTVRMGKYAKLRKAEQCSTAGREGRERREGNMLALDAGAGAGATYC
jgi:hypothetical protein